jgi:hypothetical protein
MLTYGSRLQIRLLGALFGSRPSYCCVSIVRPPLSVGAQMRINSLLRAAQGKHTAFGCWRVMVC